jgi:hypothetical protein
MYFKSNLTNKNNFLPAIPINYCQTNQRIRPLLSHHDKTSKQPQQAITSGYAHQTAK